MAVKLKPTSVIKAELGIEPNGKAQKFFAMSCYKHMDKYVPYDTGNLSLIVDVMPNRIIYESPYAHYIYEGVSKSGKPLNYKKDKHPFATKQWDKKMWSAEKDDITKEVADYIGGRR